MNPDGSTPPQPVQNMQGPTAPVPQPPVVPAVPQYAQPAQLQPTNGFAIAALVLGILGFLWVLPVLGSLLGVIFGVVALSQIKQGKGSGRGMAHTGLWLGVTSLVLTSLVVMVVLITLPALQRSTRDTARKVEANSIAAQLEAYYLENGYYPTQLKDMPQYETPSGYPNSSENEYTYTTSPDGCAGSDETIAATPSTPKCTGYTLHIKLENGTEYTKTNMNTPNLNLNNVKIELPTQVN